jgi:formylglycine-generating enzyme required for sulfatase activity
LEEVRNNLCVAKVVTVSAAGHEFGIDATEVTRGQYEDWLATNPDTAAQDATNCGWNSTFVPDADLCMPNAYKAHPCQGTACRSYSQVCVDWCDAYAYCNAVGKRLCGKIGGGPNGFDDYANAALSQWYAACSSGGVNKYPYGATYQATTCNGRESSGTDIYGILPVGSFPGCQASGGYAGVLDLSGNVWELEDSCDGTGASSHCRRRGGGHSDIAEGLTCAKASGSSIGEKRLVSGADVGFRCCSR